MNKKRFQKFLDRDGGCFHCGDTGETLVPQHRSNRGIGGGGDDSASNIIVLCAWANYALESDPEFALLGRDYGWKLSKWQDPTKEAVFDRYRGVWAYLDNDFGRWDTHNLKQ